MPGRSTRIKRAINRLVEPHRVQPRKKNKVPTDRPGIKGRIGTAVRPETITPT